MRCEGMLVEVAGIQDDGTLVLTDKRTIPPAFRQFSHGYATTSHAAQGKTVDRGIVLMAGEGIQAANLKQAYVSHSRFEESHVTYTTDRRAAIHRWDLLVPESGTNYRKDTEGSDVVLFRPENTYPRMSSPFLSHGLLFFLANSPEGLPKAGASTLDC